MTKSIQVEDSLLVDLKLVKRVLGSKNMTELIWSLLLARGYNDEWFEHMTKVLDDGRERLREHTIEDNPFFVEEVSE